MGDAGPGVLVTRPEHQAAELVAAIEAIGGRPFAFPVIEIVPRDPAAVACEAEALPAPDIAVFVSANAVHHGLSYAGGARIAAVGPATAAAIEAAGREVDIRPAAGFDSEHLLDEPALQAVRGRTIRIVRGNGGRELLATALRERGARVDYLAVYERRRPVPDAAALDRLGRACADGAIDVVVVMSVESLRNLAELLPAACRECLGKSRLVAPAQRVLKEALVLFPGVDTTLADGPGAGDLLRAIAGPVDGHS